MITKAEYTDETKTRVRVHSTEAKAPEFPDGTYEMDHPVGIDRIEVPSDPDIEVARVVFTDGSSVVLEAAHLMAISLDGYLK